MRVCVAGGKWDVSMEFGCDFGTFKDIKGRQKKVEETLEWRLKRRIYAIFGRDPGNGSPAKLRALCVVDEEVRHLLKEHLRGTQGDVKEEGAGGGAYGVDISGRQEKLGEC